VLESPEPVAEPPVPWPAPSAPEAPAGTATGNENPVLPHNSTAGAARAAALFERIITIASDADPSDASVALARIQGIAEAAIGDLAQFVPAQMRQAAGDEAARMISSV
jgi:hypothetical protein